MQSLAFDDIEGRTDRAGPARVVIEPEKDAMDGYGEDGQLNGVRRYDTLGEAIPVLAEEG